MTDKMKSTCEAMFKEFIETYEYVRDHMHADGKNARMEDIEEALDAMLSEVDPVEYAEFLKTEKGWDIVDYENENN